MCVCEDLLSCPNRDIFVLARGFLHPLEDEWVPEQDVPAELILDSMCNLASSYVVGDTVIQACEFEPECVFDGVVGLCPYCLEYYLGMPYKRKG